METNFKTCECCGSIIVDYKVTITVRNVAWLYALGWLSLQKYREEGDPYVNYKDVHNLVYQKTKYTISNYSKMSGYPFDLISRHPEKKGYWVLTKRGRGFLNNRIKIPEDARFNKDMAYKVSDKMVYASTVKKCNFEELKNKFKSY